jgi:hypothetical protein
MAPPISQEQAMADKAEKMTKVRILRDFWPTENEMDRVKAGTVTEVTMETLIDGLESGILERVKDEK